MFYVVMNCIFAHLKGLLSGGSIITLIIIVPYSFVMRVNMLPQMTLASCLVFTKDTLIPYTFMMNIHMMFQVGRSCSLIVTKCARISYTLVYCSNMLFHVISIIKLWTTILKGETCFTLHSIMWLCLRLVIYENTGAYKSQETLSLLWIDKWCFTFVLLLTVPTWSSRTSQSKP